jgi:hypothetical protein
MFPVTHLLQLGLTYLFFFFFAALGLEFSSLEPLHQPFFVMDFFKDRVSQTIYPD